MGTGRPPASRRIVHQWSFKGNKRDDRTINLMIEKVEKIAAGKIPLKKARFLKVTGATQGNSIRPPSTAPANSRD